MRERGSDIAELAEAFLQRFANEEGKHFDPLGGAQLAALTAYNWPGNVRELQNVLRRGAVLNPGPTLPIAAFPLAAQIASPLPPSIAPLPPTASSAPANPVERDVLSIAQVLAGMTLEDIERIAIESAIDSAGGSLPTAARVLGVSPSTLYRKRERWLAGGTAP